MRTNVVLDDDLVREAFAATGLRTKKELIHEALKELIRARRKQDLTALAGRIRFRDDFDPKALREMPPRDDR
jgi:Arc/MetJ family transcription regulator